MGESGYSSSSTESDGEDIGEILRGVGMSKKYGKVFAKAKIEDLDDAIELDERRLKKIGISSSTDRKKILKAIANANSKANSDSETSSSASSGTSSDSSESDSESDSDSDSESDGEFDDNEVVKALKKHGLRKHFTKLRKNKITSLRTAKKLSDRKLREIGFDSSTTRKKLLSAFGGASSSGSNGAKKSGSGSDSKGSGSGKNSNSVIKRKESSGSEKDEKRAIARILAKAGLASVAVTFDLYHVDTLEKARALSPNKLKNMGIDTLSARCTILDAFRNVSSSSHSSSDSETQSNSSSKKDNKSKSKKKGKDLLELDAEENPLLKALKRVNLEQHYDAFVKRGANTQSIRQLQDLGHNELRDIGIENSGQRSLIMEALCEADWKCVYCETWNEHRKTCVVCQKTYRKVTQGGSEGEVKFELEENVKYVGRFRPTTRIKYGEKGVIHRVLEGDFYMVRFTNKEKKTVTIRLQQNELAAAK